MTYGPIDFLALEFKTDQLTGEALPELIELVKKEIIRIIGARLANKREQDSYRSHMDRYK